VVIATSMSIETRFGSFPGNGDDVVTMADGLPGFESCQRFVIVTSSALEPFTCLQGLDGARPSFLALDPRFVVNDYTATLNLADRLRLDVQEHDSLLWLGLVQLGDDEASINLRAPVVINPRRMIGLQVIDAERPYGIDHPLPLD
jgi:flagellar assembly factor FliW